MNPLQQPLMQIMRTIVTLKPVLIDAIGIEATGFIDDNFANQGFQGETFKPWKKRAKADKGKSRKILVETGALRRSFRQTNHADYTVISTDMPYAQIHNEGGEIRHKSRSVILSYATAEGGKLRLAKTQTQAQQRQISAIRRGTIGDHTTNMPQRQFLGDSPVLQKSCEKAVLKILKTALPK